MEVPTTNRRQAIQGATALLAGSLLAPVAAAESQPAIPHLRLVPAESGSPKEHHTAAWIELMARASPRVRELLYELDAASNDDWLDELDRNVAELARHLPGAQAAIEAAWSHIVNAPEQDGAFCGVCDFVRS